MHTPRHHSAAAVLLVAASLLWSPAGHSAIVALEDFEGGAAGWTDRDAGDMTVTHQASVGAPASGAMQGEFASQVFDLPQTDAFMLNTGTDFLGSYGGLTGFQFDLFALSVLPSDAALRIVSGANTFFYTLNLASMSVGAWTQFTVPLTYGSGWQGGATEFNTALTSVDQLEVQLTRNGTSQQFYYLDNFETTSNDLGDGSGFAAVPEPASISLFLVMMLGLHMVKRNAPRASRRSIKA